MKTNTHSSVVAFRLCITENLFYNRNHCIFSSVHIGAFPTRLISLNATKWQGFFLQIVAQCLLSNFFLKTDMFLSICLLLFQFTPFAQLLLGEGFISRNLSLKSQPVWHEGQNVQTMLNWIWMVGETGVNCLAGKCGAVLCMRTDNRSIVRSECHFTFSSFLCDVAYQICQAEDHLETGQQNGLWHCLTDNREDKRPKKGKRIGLHTRQLAETNTFLFCESQLSLT